MVRYSLCGMLVRKEAAPRKSDASFPPQQPTALDTPKLAEVLSFLLMNPLLVQCIDLEKIDSSELYALSAKWLSNAPSTPHVSSIEIQRHAARAALSLLVSDDSRLIENKQHGFYTLEGPRLGKRYVSFAHTRKFAMASVSDGPVGVDIESVHRDANSVMKRVCEPSEFSFSREFSYIDGTRVANSLIIWTAKEAVAKATGLGMRLGFTNFVVETTMTPPFSVQVLKAGPIPITQPQVTIRVLRQHLIAICQSANRQDQSSVDLLIYPVS